MGDESFIIMQYIDSSRVRSWGFFIERDSTVHQAGSKGGQRGRGAVMHPFPAGQTGNLDTEAP